jgi:ABC-type multidrug transport system fused ATPase/permease subunit
MLVCAGEAVQARLDIVRDTDVVLDGDNVVEQGRHDELMSNRQDLWTKIF